MLYPAARTHDLDISGAKDPFDADTIFVRQGSFQGDGDDLHVFVRMAVKAISALDDVVVEYTQGAKMNFFAVVPVAKTKGVVAVQPAEVNMPPFRSGMEDIGHRI